MTSRLSRAAVLVVALGSLAAAAYVVFDAEQTLKAHQMARTSFDGAAQSVLSELGRLQAAEQAYVAEGQGVDYWLAQAADAQAKVDRGLAALAGDATGEGTRSAIQAGSGVLEEFRKLDLRARQYLKSNQPLMASDVIFTDGLTAGNAVAEHVSTARANEAAVHDATIDALRWREFYAAGGAALLLALAVLLLTPIPEKEVDVLTAMRALTETPVQARRAESAAAPAVARVAAVDDDVPDLGAVTAVTGRRPESFSAEDAASAQGAAATRASAPARAETLVDLPGAAKVCADMARVLDASDLPGLMLRLAGVLGSPGADCVGCGSQRPGPHAALDARLSRRRCRAHRQPADLGGKRYRAGVADRRRPDRAGRAGRADCDVGWMCGGAGGGIAGRQREPRRRAGSRHHLRGSTRDVRHRAAKRWRDNRRLD